MAKKILYKITAYHCPRCGGITEPTRKYCEYCERDLAIRSKNQNRVRLLIDCGNYVFFDSIKNIDFTSTPQIIETTMLSDCRQHYIKGLYDNKFRVDMMATARTAELFQLEYTGLHKIRLECLDIDMAYEQQCYISNSARQLFPHSNAIQSIDFIGVGESTMGSAIPIDVMNEARCKNCGAPIKSRYGACDYCGGWNELEW